LRARTSGVTIEIAPATQNSWGLGDPGSVARIVRIMLDNALRVAPPVSAITIAVAEHHGRVAVEVHDAGPGVPEEERERIFERFRRGSGRAGEGGFGLGLAIGRELALRMEGNLELAASPPAPDTTFRLSLPLARVRVEA
jgi:signal transduction histidine kinase